MLDAFKPILDAPQMLHPWLLSQVASVLSHAGHVKEAHALSDVMVERSEPDTDHLLVAGLPRSDALLSRASMLIGDGRHEDAWPVLREAERLACETNSRRQLASALGGLAVVHMRRGELAHAWEALKEAEHIARESGDPQALERSLRHQLAVLERQLAIARGDANAVSVLLAETEKIARELGDHRAVAGALLDQATSALGRGDTAEAAGLASRACELARERGIADAQSRASMILATAQPRLG